jgi:hypothetical protein
LEAALAARNLEQEGNRRFRSCVPHSCYHVAELIRPMLEFIQDFDARDASRRIVAEGQQFQTIDEKDQALIAVEAL